MPEPKHTPMMKCGHAAQAVDSETRKPCCSICWPKPEAEIIDEGGDEKLTGRRARCAHYGQTPNGRNHSSNYGCERGEKCLCERDSSSDLPFFKHLPDMGFDEFYCGCWGWE